MKLSDRIQLIEEKLNLLMNNHLKHMEDRIKRTEWLQWSMILLLLGIAWNVMF
jgi:hypothetical protein